MAKVWIGAALLVPLTLPALAAADSRNATEDYFEDLPVVLTASRLKQSASQAPSAVTVIDREMIVASGARQIVDLLRLVPGFYVGYTNGNTSVAGYHGLSDAYARRMQVLVDGVSIYSPLYGGVEWTELPVTLQDIERIEVVRGPNAVSYGANAFLGVINIITRDPATEPRFQAELNLGGNGTQDAAARFAQRGEHWRYRLTLAQRNDDGFSNLPDSSRINLANLRGAYRIDAVDEVSFQLRASRGTEWQGFNTPYTNDSGALRPRDVAQETMQLRWTHARSADDEFWIQVSHHNQRPRETVYFDLLVPPLPPIPYSASFDYDLQRNDIEFQQLHRLGETARMVWGGQWREDAVHSYAFFHTEDWQRARLARLFGNFEWRPLVGLGVHGGVMVEHNSIAGSSLSPRLAMTWDMAPGHVLRLAVSRANRTPTLFENRTNQTFDTPWMLTPFMRGLPLKTAFLSSGTAGDEKILSREIGYVMDFPQLKLSGDIRLFKDQISDLIYGAATRPVAAVFNDKKAFDYFNSSEGVQQHGIEASGHWHPWSGAQIDATASLTHIDSGMSDTVQSAPSHTRSLLYRQSLPYDILFSAAYYMVGSMRWQNSSAWLPAHDTLDLRVSKQYRWGDRNVEAALVVRNAKGEYRDYNAVNIERQVSYLQLKIAD